MDVTGLELNLILNMDPYIEIKEMHSEIKNLIANKVKK
jgi:hypothetical protein